MDVKRRARTIFQLEPLLSFDESKQWQEPFAVSQAPAREGTPGLPSPGVSEDFNQPQLQNQTQPQKEQGATDAQLTPRTIFAHIEPDHVEESDRGPVIPHSPSAFRRAQNRSGEPHPETKKELLTNRQNRKTEQPQIARDAVETLLSPGSWSAEGILEFPPANEAMVKMYQPPSPPKAERGKSEQADSFHQAAEGRSQQHRQDLGQKKKETEQESVVTQPAEPTIDSVPSGQFLKDDRHITDSPKATNGRELYWLDDFTKDLRVQETNQTFRHKPTLSKALVQWLETPVAPEPLPQSSNEMIPKTGQARMSTVRPQPIEAGQSPRPSSAYIPTSNYTAPQAVSSRREPKAPRPVELHNLPRKSSWQGPNNKTKLSIQIGKLSIRQTPNEEEITPDRQPIFSLREKRSAAPGVLQRSTEKYTLQLPIGLV